MTDDFIPVVSQTSTSAVMRRATWVLTTSESLEPGAMIGRLHRSQSSHHKGRHLIYTCHMHMWVQDLVAHPRRVAAGMPLSHATVRFCNQPRLLQNVVYQASTPTPTRDPWNSWHKPADLSGFLDPPAPKSRIFGSTIRN